MEQPRYRTDTDCPAQPIRAYRPRCPSPPTSSSQLQQLSPRLLKPRAKRTARLVRMPVHNRIRSIAGHAHPKRSLCRAYLAPQTRTGHPRAEPNPPRMSYVSAQSEKTSIGQSCFARRPNRGSRRSGRECDPASSPRETAWSARSHTSSIAKRSPPASPFPTAPPFGSASSALVERAGRLESLPEGIKQTSHYSSYFRTASRSLRAEKGAPEREPAFQHRQ